MKSESMEQSAGVGQFWTPIMAVGGSLLHADPHMKDYQMLNTSLIICRIVRPTSQGAPAERSENGVPPLVELYEVINCEASGGRIRIRFCT
jgi:hypothetical protein